MVLGTTEWNSMMEHASTVSRNCCTSLAHILLQFVGLELLALRNQYTCRRCTLGSILLKFVNQDLSHTLIFPNGRPTKAQITS